MDGFLSGLGDATSDMLAFSGDDSGATVDVNTVAANAGDTVFLPDGTQIDKLTGSVTLSNGQQFDSTGGIITQPDGTIINKAANTVTTPDGVVYTGANQIALPFGITDAQVAAFTAKLGATAGQWIAKQVGGQTVLYNQSAGGLGTLNIQNLLLPAALLIGVLMLT